MKRIFVALALFLAGVSGVQAQVTFNPIVRGGLNVSRFTNGEPDYQYTYDYNAAGQAVKIQSENLFSSTTNFYVGLAGALKFNKLYTLQPELNYSAQGTRAKLFYNPFTNAVEYGDLKVSYLGAQVINKFNFKKFNVHVGPGLDFITSKNFKVENDVDLTLSLGAGYDITKNFGVEARFKVGVAPVLQTTHYSYSGNSSYSKTENHTNALFSFGAYYKFDIK
ncbi:outer membrane beta-barrel protein [Flavobacterium oreochromis]|nr:outer membrane beta-barrel protein [Flavobacterium oreochromis]QYS86756.1 PorT family protein [Flavobacterium oreochromis]